jgi:hypothetical protein
VIARAPAANMIERRRVDEGSITNTKAMMMTCLAWRKNVRLVGGDSLSSLTKTNLLLYTLYTQYIFSCPLHVTTQAVMDRQMKILELDRVFFSLYIPFVFRGIQVINIS